MDERNLLPEPEGDWKGQLVWLPVSQLLHYERMVAERDAWATRNYELQCEIDALREMREE